MGKAATLAAEVIALRERVEKLSRAMKQDAMLFDALADTLEAWAHESRAGGWSPHQVDRNNATAKAARHYASTARTALKGAGE